MQQPINQNAEFCGRVPLHQTNSIQPHGVLLVLNKADHRILQASENAGDVFGRSLKEIISFALPDLVSTDDAERLQKLLDTNTEGKLPLTLHINSSMYLSVLHRQDDFYFLEIDKQKRSDADEQSFLAVYQNLKFIIAAIDAAATTEETCDVVVQELKKLSGFDKVMVYRFDESWNGDVIAEAAEDGMDRYLGLKFPASDIPKQARELYKKTPYRLIPNIRYEPVKLYPVLNPGTNAFTNLSDSNLRSVAPVHLEYLRNMAVMASMSTRILKGGELWGLIACHHRTPNYLSFEMCSVFELLSTVVTAKIGAVQANDAAAHGAAKQKQLVDYIQAVYSHQQTAPLLQLLLEADGVAVVTNDRLQTHGSTPPVPDITDLVAWLDVQEAELVHEPCLSAVYEPATGYAQQASGMLAVPVGDGGFILAFRQEAVKTVVWGGNPSEAIRFENGGKGYHPRDSFQQWQQTVKKTSVPWPTETLQMVGAVRDILTAYRLHK